MHILKNIIIFLLISSLLVLCTKEQNEVIMPKQYTIAKAEKILLDVSNKLGYNSFSSLLKNQRTDDNLIISPINIALSFNLLLQASDKNTAREIKRYLNVSHLKDSNIIAGFDQLNKLFSGIDQNVIIDGSNKLAAHPELDIESGFRNFVEKRHYAEIIEDENAGFIEDINSISSGAGVSDYFQMINSIEFSAQIKYQTQVEESPFYTNPDESSFVKMIVAESTFNYYSDLTIKAVELPLGRGNFNILLIVPQGSQTLGDLAINMDGRLLKRVKNKFKSRQMEVYMPMLELSGVETFKNVFISSRLNDCFNGKRANFSKLSKKELLYMSDFEQVVSLGIADRIQNQQIVSNSMFETSPENKTSFLIDHPFLFVVYEKYSEGVIFIGKIVKL